ncbi:PREDICTED: uncharacterized protein LOC106125238 [Papilio xuthus]|uniref:Uncharacterized protein LOC106125238 n=1 Tax=Papilio xuthus TaxID=66420 RepID=A0AAJ6ZRD8_PAPXU|nr:PREDICTED: uncharacterized protein LOC106125238 [Papilio xuthus]
MQCFICVIYLVISCKALPYKDPEILPFENNATISFNNNTRSELSNDKFKIEISELANSHTNRTQTNESEINRESVDKTKVIDEKVMKSQEEPDATTMIPTGSSSNDTIFSGINKEYIKYMITGAKETDHLFRPILNEMEDMSQIGDTDRLTIINPTVIVNFRGSIWNKESDIKLAQKKKDKRKPENTND